MNAVDYENPSDSDSNNIYAVSVNFSDDLNTTTQAIEPVSYTHLTLPTNREV